MVSFKQTQSPSHAPKLIGLILVLQLIQFECLSSTSIRQSLYKSTYKSTGKLGQPVTSYFARFELGTPAKTFNLLVDVNAREVWVPHYLKLGLIYLRLNYQDGYSKKDSSTSVKEDKEFKIEYQGTELEGKIYRDRIQLKGVIGSNSTATATTTTPIKYTQRFMAISSANNDDFKRYRSVDGVFALNPAFTSETGSELPILAMKQANLIDDLKFSLSLNSDLDSNIGGEIIFGTELSSKYSSALRYHQTINQFKWEIGVQSVLLGSETVSCLSSQCQAVISTTESDLYGPAKDVARIMKALNLINNENDYNPKKLYEIECLRVVDVPPLYFMIDGIYYTVNPARYVSVKTEGLVFKTSTCYIAILANSGSPSAWTLGTNFLTNYYTIFDAGRRQIAFANKSQTSSTR